MSQDGMKDGMEGERKGESERGEGGGGRVA